MTSNAHSRAPKRKAKRSAKPPAGENEHVHVLGSSGSAEPAMVVAARARLPDTIRLARATLFDALYKAVGQPGSQLVHPEGQSFTLKAELVDGHVLTPKTVMVSLPSGGSTAHLADLAIETDRTPPIYVDVLDTGMPAVELKARAFDVLQLKSRSPKPFTALVYVRVPHAVLRQEQVEALAFPYDYVFGVDAENLPLVEKFAACRAEIQRQISPAGRGGPTRRPPERSP